jgi:hypothetical protein
MGPLTVERAVVRVAFGLSLGGASLAAGLLLLVLRVAMIGSLPRVRAIPLQMMDGPVAGGGSEQGARRWRFSASTLLRGFAQLDCRRCTHVQVGRTPVVRARIGARA